MYMQAFLNAGKPPKKAINCFLIAIRRLAFVFFPPGASWSTSRQLRRSLTSLSKLVRSPGRYLSITDNRSQRWKQLSTTESLVLGVNADCIHSNCRQKPDVSGCFYQWKMGFTLLFTHFIVLTASSWPEQAAVFRETSVKSLCLAANSRQIQLEARDELTEPLNS